MKHIRRLSDRFFPSSSSETSLLPPSPSKCICTLYLNKITNLPEAIRPKEPLFCKFEKLTSSRQPSQQSPISLSTSSSQVVFDCYLSLNLTLRPNQPKLCSITLIHVDSSTKRITKYQTRFDAALGTTSQQTMCLPLSTANAQPTPALLEFTFKTHLASPGEHELRPFEVQHTQEMNQSTSLTAPLLEKRRIESFIKPRDPEETMGTKHSIRRVEGQAKSDLRVMAERIESGSTLSSMTYVSSEEKEVQLKEREDQGKTIIQYGSIVVESRKDARGPSVVREYGERYAEEQGEEQPKQKWYVCC